MKRIVVLAALVLSACNSGEGPAAGASASASTPAEANTSRVITPPSQSPTYQGLSPEREAGMFRWKSGTQMGQLWAGVTNKSENALRLFSSDSANPPVWEVELEIADERFRSALAKGRQVNFVVAEQAAPFLYHVEAGAVVLEMDAPDGAREAPKFLDMLRKANGRVACAEFPEAEYRTCFSTKGAAEAL